MTRRQHRSLRVCDEAQQEAGTGGVTGLLAGLATPLAAARISIFALSTYDTDYLLVRHDDRERAVRTLREAGHTVSEAAGIS